MEMGWMCQARESKVPSDSGLSDLVIKGDILERWKGWGKNRSGVHGEWKSKDVYWTHEWR
jgi:hypothetical protein